MSENSSAFPVFFNFFAITHRYFFLRMSLYYLHPSNAVALNKAQDTVVLDAVYTSTKFYREAAVTQAVQHTGRGQAGYMVGMETGPIIQGH